jgi:hypothetical protein
MSKKNIIKLNDKSFYCNPINNFENFENLPIIKAETGKKIVKSESENANVIIINSKKKKRSKKKSKKRSKKKSKKRSKKKSKKRSKKRSKKKSKKIQEGFCAGDTCINESDLKNIINLLKKLDFKK